jgi:nucleoside-diphosphate-sugar epimerase
VARRTINALHAGGVFVTYLSATQTPDPAKSSRVAVSLPRVEVRRQVAYCAHDSPRAVTAPTALIIGGTGPSGPHVLQGMIERGYDASIFHRGVHEPPDLPEVTHIHGDPHFAETVADALDGREFDVVISMYGRLRIIADAVAGRCRQLVATTGTVGYENCLLPHRGIPAGMKVMARESDPQADAHGEAPSFSAGVLAAERLVLRHAADGDYQGTIIHYPTLYGPRNVVPQEWSIMKRVRDSRRYMLVTDGGLAITSRCAARNAAHGVLCAVDHPEAADGESYNCADRDQYTQAQWIELVAHIMGAELEVVAIPLDIGMATFAELSPMEGRVPHGILDTTKIRRDLGYEDVLEARVAIAEYVAWLDANPPNLSEHASGFVDRFDYDAEDRLLAAYRAAVARILAEVPRDVPVRRHALPHPKVPSTGRDHSGR